MSDHSHGGSKYVSLLQEFSIPLLAGVVAALAIANISPGTYDRLVRGTWSYVTGEEYHGHGHAVAHSDGHAGEHGHADEHAGEAKGDPGHVEHHEEGHDENAHESGDDHDAGHDEPDVAGAKVAGNEDSDDHSNEPWWHHYATLHFLINDLFMVVFFGVAAKEITEACLPGGALNPISKAINPLLGTIGGVVGPVGVYFLLNAIPGFGNEVWANGWGIPTATDIALAWLIARLVFGNGHPAIAFLLLLAVADDGIGLGIIAIFYPNPARPTEWLNSLWIIPGMAVAYLFRRMEVKSWVPYIFLGGGLSWWGLFSAHLHPALALVPIVPLLPGPKYDEGLFRDDVTTIETDTLNNFEHAVKMFVDFGLFFFAFANAGVPFSNVNNLTWIVLLSLLAGKTIGIFFFSYVGQLIGFPLPQGMKAKHLFVAGVVAGLGLTVALFVAGQAFQDPLPQGAAKMGALFSGGIAFLALILGNMLGVKDGAGQAVDEKSSHVSGDKPTDTDSRAQSKAMESSAL